MQTTARVIYMLFFTGGGSENLLSIFAKYLELYHYVLSVHQKKVLFC